MDTVKPEHRAVEEISDAGKPQEIIDLEAVGEREGYVLNDASLAHDQGLKTAADGTTILIPQPSASPNDPLNWTSYRKHLILIVISCTAFLPDYGSATGAVTLKPQGA
jgi:hypothetical protein